MRNNQGNFKSSDHAVYDQDEGYGYGGDSTYGYGTNYGSNTYGYGSNYGAGYGGYGGSTVTYGQASHAGGKWW